MKEVLVNNNPEEIILSEDVAFDKDDKMWDVWETKRMFSTSLSTMGKLRFILSEDGKILAESLPMFNFNNGFTLVSKNVLDQWKRRLS